ncbi:MAG: metallophosphoesterase [Sulfolobales archaeon]
MSKSSLIAVVSDSHDNLVNVDKAINLIKSRGVDTVIHLGDIIAPFTLARFIGAGLRVIAVFGNNDGEKIVLKKVAERGNSEINEPPHTIVLNGRKILMIHGKGSVEETREYVEALASSGYYDVILYGHTHAVDSRVVKNTLVLNPGEIYGFLSGRASFAFLDLDKLEVEIVNI